MNTRYIAAIAAGALVFFYIFIIIPVFGLHIVESRGGQVGYVSVAERNGIIITVGRVFLKTDAESSQETAYCVIDRDVYRDLENASLSGQRVSVRYVSYFKTAFWECGPEEPVIIGVQ